MKKSTTKALAKQARQQAISKKKARALTSLKVHTVDQYADDYEDLAYYRAAAYESSLEHDMGGTSYMQTDWR